MQCKATTQPLKLAVSVVDVLSLCINWACCYWCMV